VIGAIGCGRGRAVAGDGAAAGARAARYGQPDDVGISTASGPAAGASLRGEPVVTTLRRGDVVGRYVIITQLGQGGMGVVYAAYDPELDRRVALKLLIAGEDGEAPLEARTRLLREAQALAQLSHPAVVAIHDVGTLGRQVWLAMEFVAGETLTAWLAAAPRGWAEVLAMFRSAGEGLAAAHAAGLVHRDFKPKSRPASPKPPPPAKRRGSPPNGGFEKCGACPWLLAGPPGAPNFAKKPAAIGFLCRPRPGDGSTWATASTPATDLGEPGLDLRPGRARPRPATWASPASTRDLGEPGLDPRPGRARPRRPRPATWASPASTRDLGEPGLDPRPGRARPRHAELPATADLGPASTSPRPRHLRPASTRDLGEPGLDTREAARRDGRPGPGLDTPCRPVLDRSAEQVLCGPHESHQRFHRLAPRRRLFV
jgi:hypothetical protein